MYIAECKCGIKVTVRSSALSSGHTKSCGCFQKERANAARFKHGHSSHRGSSSKEYRTWKGLKTRCLNKKRACYKHYGARGIKVCKRWLNSFENFLEDMGPCPAPKMQVERIDNNKGYSPENCKWATSLEQTNNTRRNRFLTYNNITKTVAQWSRELKIPYRIFSYRIKKGMNIEEILKKIGIKYGC